MCDIILNEGKACKPVEDAGIAGKELNVKMVGKILITLLVIAIAVVACVILFKFSKSGKLPDINVTGNVSDGDGMINASAFDYISYFYGGGEYGDLYRLTLDCEDNLTYEKCEGHGCEMIEVKYKIPSSYTPEIMDVISNNVMYKWKKLKKNDLMELDAPHMTFEIDFIDGNNIIVGSDDILPEGKEGGIREIVEIMEKAINDEATVEVESIIRNDD